MTGSLGSAGSRNEQIMAETAAQQPPGQRRHPATVGDVVQPPLTTVDPEHDHAAAAAYLMRHAGATALVVLDGQVRPTGRWASSPMADIVHTVADGQRRERGPDP